MAKRIFTENELHELTKSGMEKYFSKANDHESSQEAVKQMYKEWQGTHDLYRDWLTSILSVIGRQYGDETLHDILKETVSVYMKPLAERIMKNNDRRTVVEGMAAALRGHLGAYSKIEEDDDKFTFEMPCPSGGLLVTEGRYEPPFNFLKIANPQAMTFGRKDFPVYCAHCYFQDALPLEWFGEPLWLTVPAAKIGHEPCTRYLYKNAKDVPKRFYETYAKMNNICKNR